MIDQVTESRNSCGECGTPFGVRRRCYQCNPGGIPRNGKMRICRVCSKEFYVPHHQTKAYPGGGTYCSRECKYTGSRVDPIVPGRGRRWARNMRVNYGLTVEEYDSLLSKQGNRCAICDAEPGIGPGKALHVDHCHDTSRIRGLLCSKCNTMIGLGGDNVDVLLAAIAYLKRSE